MATLDSIQDSSTPIVLDDGTTTAPSVPVATSRANDAIFALPSVPKTFNDYFTPISAGKEPALRQDVAATVDYQKAAKRQQMISDIAAKKGGPLNPEDLSIIEASLNAPPTDPKSVFEEHYAKQYMDHLNWPTVDTDTDSWYNEAVKLMPGAVQQLQDQGIGLATYRQFSNTALQDAEEAYNSQSYLGWGVDLLKGAFQPYSEIKMRGLVPEVSKYSGLLGSNINQQIDYLYSLPFPEYKARVTEIMNNLKKDNPSLAVQFGKYLVGAPSSTEFLDNFFSATAGPLDVLGVGKVGFKATRAAFLFGETKAAVKDMTQLLVNTEKQPVKVVANDAAGNLAEAASLKATSNAVSELSSVGEQTAKKTALEALPSVLKADKEAAIATPGRFGQEIVNRISQSYDTFTTNLMTAIENISRLERIPGTLATQKAVRAIQEAVKDEYPGLRNTVLDVGAPYRVLDNYFVDVVLGTNRGEYFMNPATASRFRDVYNIPDAVISKQKSGIGYYLLIKKPLKETEDVVRDFLTETKNAKTPEPDSWLKQFVDYIRPIRTSEEILSADQRMNRKVALYSSSILQKIYKENAASIRQLMGVRGSIMNRQEQKDWIRVVEHERDMIDPKTGLKGYFFENPQELENHYQQFIGRLPSHLEIESYFAFKRATEMDRMMRNMSLYKYMSRVGAEHQTIYAVGADGVRQYSDKFAGITRNVFPGGEDGILVMSKTLGEEKYYRGGAVPPSTLQKLRDEVNTGKKVVIEIYDPESRPLSNFGEVGDKRVRYVVTERYKTTNLPIDLLPRRGGGHIEYDYEHYIKQAKIRPDRFVSPEGDVKFHHWYEGDATVMPMQNRVLGEKIAGHLNQFREALLYGNEDLAKQIAQNLPIDYKEMKSWFKSSYGPKGEKISPRLSLEEDFRVVSRDKKILDIDKSLEKKYEGTFRDGTKEGSAARQYQVAYSGERDAYEVNTITDKGTRHNPLWGYDAAKYLDPMATMNRAMNRIIKSSFMDDYKIFSVENWLQEAMNSLEATTERVRAAPFYYFQNIKWKKDADPAFTRRMDIAKKQIDMFTGVPSTLDAHLHAVSQKLADSIYSKFGSEEAYGPIGKRLLLAPTWAIAHLTDPFTFLRSVTYHASIGLFAIPQLLVQQMTYATILGVAGDHAVPGTLGALLHGYSRLNRNPAILKKLDEIASGMHIPGLTSRWKPGEFMESLAEYEKSGFSNVGGTHILTDDELAPKIFNNGIHQFLEAGTIFFKGGEKSVRAGAWHTAFREFREANPLGRITNYERNQILERADLLAGNMSSASKSVLQRGPLAFTTQFLGYQMRLLELMTGKRLNWTERARLVTTYATMFGVPATAGISGIPLGDALKKYATDHGYVLGQDNNTAVDTLMEGVPAAMLSIITGRHYNVGERFGSPGFDAIRQFMAGDLTGWALFGGAAGSMLENAWTSNSGFRTMTMNAIKGEGKFQPNANDALDIVRNVNSVNRTTQMIVALNTGRMLSKNDTLMEKNVPGWDAVFRYVTGLTSEDSASVSIKTWTMKEEKQAQEEGFKLFQKDMNRGFRSLQINDYEQSQAYFSRAFQTLDAYGWPREKMHEALSRLSGPDKILINSIDWSYYERNVPDARAKAQQGAYQKQLNATKGQW